MSANKIELGKLRLGSRFKVRDISGMNTMTLNTMTLIGRISITKAGGRYLRGEAPAGSTFVQDQYGERRLWRLDALVEPLGEVLLQQHSSGAP